MEDLVRDLRFGLRSLRRQRGFALVAVFTISLGIAAATTMFSLVNGILLRPLPYPEPDRIVAVWPQEWFAHIMFEKFAEEVSSYESLAIFGPRTAIELSEDGAARWVGPRASSRFFDVLGVPPLLGRTFEPGEDRPGADDVIVLSYGLWQRRFEGDRGVIGRRIHMSGGDRTVIGVMPEGFPFPSYLGLGVSEVGDSADVAFPQTIEPESAAYRSQDWKLIGRLKPGVSREAAQAELRVVVSAWRREFDLPEDWGTDATVETLREFLVGDVRPTLLLLFGAVGLILLIATANVANLLLARSLSRRRELAVRAALGARPGRLARQLLTESSLLGLVGAVPGLVASIYGLRAVVGLLPRETPRLAEVSVDLRVLGFCVAVALLTGWIVGIVPALQTGGRDARAALVSGGRSATDSRERRRLRVGIVAAEVAVAVVLLTGAGLLVKSFWRLTQVDPGFEVAGLVKFRVTPEDGRVTAVGEMRTLFEAMEREVEAIPAVRSAATIWKAPLSPDGGVTGYRPADRQLVDGELPPVCRYRPITRDYFRVSGMSLLQGRGFASTDRSDSEPVAILSLSAADELFPGESAIGKRIQVQMPGEPEATVVGVVGDAKLLGLADRSPAVVYRPYEQTWGTIDAFQAYGRAFIVRVDGAPERLAELVRGAIREVDPNALVSDFETLPAAVSASLADRRVTMILLTVFTAVAVALGAIGIYGLMAYTVRSRSRELGIRIALGASRADVRRQIVIDAAKVAGGGAAAGLGLAVALSRTLDAFLFEVASTDPWVLAAATSLVVAVAMLATVGPARRASRADPMAIIASE